MRAVVDTNVWVSATVKPAGNCRRVLDAYLAGQFQGVTSAPLLEEVGTVLTRPRFARVFGVTPEDAAQIVALLTEHSERVELTGASYGCRDPKDEMVIETALRGGAVYIVSGDKDLVDDAKIRELLALGGVTVMTVRQFLDALEEGDGEP